MSPLPTLLALLAILVLLGCTPSDYERGQAAYEDEAYKSAIEFLEPLAIGGDQAAKLALGTVYRCGDDSVQDYAAAAKWYLAAGDHKVAVAHKWLASYFSSGRGGAPDQERAREEMRIAAELGDANSQFILSNWLSHMDWDASIHWRTLAAEQDHVYAQDRLAQNYRLGHGVPVDPEKAVYWVRRAAENGSHFAEADLARHYRDGYGGLEVDIDAALQLLESAVAKELSSAAYQLGWMYAKGDGVTKDNRKACELYRVAADNRDSHGTFELAMCFEEGNGVERNLVEAFRWYTLAAKIAEENINSRDQRRRLLESLPQRANRRSGNHIALEERLERLGVLRTVMTQSEIAAAELLVEQWELDYQQAQETRVRSRSIWDDCP